VNEPAELGRSEGDQIIGYRNRSSMLWLTESVTRYSIGATMPEGYAGDAMLTGLVEGLEKIPSHLFALYHLRPRIRMGLLGANRRHLRHQGLVL
jgi:hypothetical protein